MAQLLLIVVGLGLLALVVARVRGRQLHFRVADWPPGKQIETGIAMLFGLLALLGAVAGEFLFAGWLALMAMLVAVFSVLTWPRAP